MVADVRAAAEISSKQKHSPAREQCQPFFRQIWFRAGPDGPVDTGPDSSSSDTGPDSLALIWLALAFAEKRLADTDPADAAGAAGRG